MEEWIKSASDDDLVRAIYACSRFVRADVVPGKYERVVYDAVRIFIGKGLKPCSPSELRALGLTDLRNLETRAVELMNQLVSEHAGEQRIRLRHLNHARELVRQATDGLRCESLRRTALGTIERLERLVLASEEDPTLRTRGA